MKTTAVIMAGGKGERFWPKSRQSLPKQFLSLTDDGKTMIQLTVERNLPIVGYEDMFVVTNRDYVPLVRSQLPGIPPENILAEPVGRNTAPCIGFAAAVIKKRYTDAVMLVLASDHLIQNNTLYADILSQAVDVAMKEENLVTIGITPTYPETGYGYIHLGVDNSAGETRGVYPVERFVEKPDLDTAKTYVSSGEYLWNSGMFVWKASTILRRYQELLPEIYQGLVRISGAYGTPDFDGVLYDCFLGFPSESVDFGIMEHTSNIYALPGNFGWDDVGSWPALARINKTNESGNMLQGDIVAIGTRNTIIMGEKKLIAAVGVENLVIVDAGDAMLICNKNAIADVKKIIEHLQIFNRSELL